MPLIYSFVARANDRVVLAEYSAYAGNFHAVATEVLGSLDRLDPKFTIAADKHTFNFLVENGYGGWGCPAAHWGGPAPGGAAAAQSF